MDTNLKLPGDYISGFVDGEGCFALKFRRDRKQNVGNKKFRDYFYWGVELAIVLRDDDLPILNSIKYALGCGHINSLRNGQARFSIQNPKEICEKIIPFFNKYPLRAKKGSDFELWSKAAWIINKYRDGEINTQKGHRGFTKKEMTNQDINKLNKIREEMLAYKSKRAKPFRW